MKETTVKANELRIGNWYEYHEGDECNNKAVVCLKNLKWTQDGIGYLFIHKDLKRFEGRKVRITIETI